MTGERITGAAGEGGLVNHVAGLVKIKRIEDTR